MIKKPRLTTIGGIFPTPSNRILGNPTTATTVSNLFNNGEKGYYYDPTDLNTMFQGTNGTVKVTTNNQNIGLVLDKKKGIKLVSTTVDDQGFNNSSSWFNTDVWIVGNGVASGTHISKGLYQGNKITVGKLYKATLTVDLISGSLRLPYDGDSSNVVTITSSGTYTRYFLGTLTNFYAAFGINFTGSISNLSVVEVDGNHAYQNTPLLQPTFKTPPNKIKYGVVTKLVTTLTEVLTGCTVVRAIPNVGTQILLNQTLSTIVEDTINHSGLLVINRALTTAETTAITAEFNKKAGV